MRTKSGKVYIVGAGPGDPGLITVKGLEAIKNADVVIYDFLASPCLLDSAPLSCEKICVGKADGLHLLEQPGINKLLYIKAKKARQVVRLKGGDPFLFSRGIEEALYLSKKGINFEIIPGVTSAFSAPQSFGIPLTRKGRQSSVAVLTGRKSNGKPLDAPGCDTLVYLMAVNNLEKVLEALRVSGRGQNTPCAFIEKGTTEEERVIVGTLKNISQKAAKFALKSPAVFVVGDVVSYGKKIYGHKYKIK